MFIQQFSKTSHTLDQQITALQKKLSTSPEGHLICCHDKKHCKWYWNNGHTRQYLPRSKRDLAEQLAIKKYDTYVLNELTQQKKAVDSYLHHYPAKRKSEHLLTIPGYAELLSSHFRPLSDELSEWMTASYEQNQSHPEHLIHKTLSGHYVRSKSEAMIDSLLFTNRIPFRYECALVLDGLPIYPDFTIRHPKTGRIYYWEHFGLMDDPAYCRRTSSKLQLYISHEIIPSIHLITTYETQQNPLTIEMIQKIIDHYFLS